MSKTKSIFVELYGSGSYSNHYCSGQQYGGGNYVSSLQRKCDSTISYDTLPTVKGIKPFNNCSHRKLLIDNRPLNIKCSSSGTYYFEYHDAVHPIFSISEDDLAFTKPTVEELNNWNKQAFDDMTPSLEGDLSITNFLLELTDVKTLLTSVRKLWDVAKRWSSLRNKKLSLVRGAGEGHLSYAFGIAPFIRDVQEIYNSLTNYSNKLDDFMKRAGTLQRRHWRTPYDVTSTSVKVFDTPYMTVTKTMQRSSVTHFSMTYRYAVGTDLKSTWGKVKAFRDMIGLRLNAAVIWEAIPFSFLVDWLLPVGSWLEQFSQPAVDTTLTVVQYGYSYKVVTSGKVVVDYSLGPCPSIGRGQIESSTASQKLYVRRRTLPFSGTYFTQARPLGGSNLALSSSLIAVNWPRKGRRR